MKTLPQISIAILALAFSVTSGIGKTLSTKAAESVARREISRRQAAIPRGEMALARGEAAMAAGKLTAAYKEFRIAIRHLPDSTPSRKSRVEAVEGFHASGMRLAEQRISNGRYKDAEAICREILSYDARFRPAAELLARLQQPGQLNRTISPQFLSKAETVKRLLVDADGYYQSARFDLAFKKYEEVLDLDPYNVAARRGQERINLARMHYGAEAFNETRSRQLGHVQRAWEQPVRSFGQSNGSVTESGGGMTGTARITRKLNSIVIPRIEFRDASVREAIEFIRQQAEENDPADEGSRGINIVLRLGHLGRPAERVTVSEPSQVSAADGGLQGVAAPAVFLATANNIPADPAGSSSDSRITLTLNDIPLVEALRYVASQAGLKVKIEPYAVSIIPINEQSTDLFTKEYRVPPSFITGWLSPTNSSLNTTGGSNGGNGKDTQESTGGRSLVNREGAKEFLQSEGVSFTVPGSSANFLPQTSRLIVRNTADNLELVDAIVEQANLAIPKQVEIEAKFVEISQNNLKELGFDWLVGPFNLNSKGGVAITGGTSGTGTLVNQADYPFPINGLNPVTAGNRSGNTAITGSAIDSLLLGAAGGMIPAPGIFGVGGLLTDPQFQVVVRALNQKKGVDLLSSPRVTTKSGQRALIEIVREFRYPTQFDPPQVPQTVGSTAAGSDTSLVSLSGGSSVPVTPTTPTHFETRNTGVTLEVEPVVGPDGVTIDLNLVPQVVEFEGFINYGSPILAPSRSFIDTMTGGLVTSPQSVITSNVINQPVFSTRKVTTSVTVWDGQTVVLGGLMREDVQKTEDRTPILGSVPLVGRLFRTNAEQHIKRNLIIFVTARLINPGGQLMNPNEEMEELDGLLEPPNLPEVPFSKK